MLSPTVEVASLQRTLQLDGSCCHRTHTIVTSQQAYSLLVPTGRLAVYRGHSQPNVSTSHRSDTMFVPVRMTDRQCPHHSYIYVTDCRVKGEPSFDHFLFIWKKHFKFRGLVNTADQYHSYTIIDSLWQRLPSNRRLYLYLRLYTRSTIYTIVATEVANVLIFDNQWRRPFCYFKSSHCVLLCSYDLFIKRK